MDKIKNKDITDTSVNIRVGVLVLKDYFNKNDSFDIELGCYLGARNADKINEYKESIFRRKQQILQLASI